MATSCLVFHWYFTFVIILNQYTVSARATCDELVMESMEVTEGDNVVLNVSISRNEYYKGSIFLWKKGNEEFNRCTAHCEQTYWQRGNCKAYGEIDTRFNQIVVLNFTEIAYTDRGLYSLEVQDESITCKWLETNITVHVSVPDPVCVTTYMMENNNVRFTCKWNSTFDYKAEILSINQTTHRTRSAMDHETNVTSSYHDNAVHLELTLNEIFSEYSPPIACIITRFGRNRVCVFPPLFMSPKITKIENNSASLECCTGQEPQGGLWLYTSQSNTFRNSAIL